MAQQEQVSLGELQDFADSENIEYDDDISYEEMRDLITIHECKQCGDEFILGWTNDFCSDTCEFKYIEENFN